MVDFADLSAAIAGRDGREAVSGALPNDPQRALAMARSIGHAWYRCQSLAAVANILDDPLRGEVLAEAFRVADELAEPNRIVTVASHAIAVLAQRGPQFWLIRELERLLGIIATEPHTLRRADALGFLLHRLWPVAWARTEVLEQFIAACAASHGWRRDRLLRSTACRLAEIDIAAANGMVEMIEEDKIRRKAAREIAAVVERNGRDERPAR